MYVKRTRYCKQCGKELFGRVGKMYCNSECQRKYNLGLRLQRISDNPEAFIKEELKKNENVSEKIDNYLDKYVETRVVVPSKHLQLPLSTNKYRPLGLKVGDVIKITIDVVYRVNKDE